MNDSTTPPSVRLKAALYVLNQAPLAPAPPTIGEWQREHQIRLHRPYRSAGLPPSTETEEEPEPQAAKGEATDATLLAELNAMEAVLTQRETTVAALEQQLATHHSSQFNTSAQTPPAALFHHAVQAGSVRQKHLNSPVVMDTDTIFINYQ